VWAAVDDVARKLTETQREFWTEVEQHADDYKHCAEEKKQPAELLRWFHDDSVARALKD
jgi:hypothetical protein